MMKIAEKYKKTDIGIIPLDWDIDYIKNIAVIKTGSRNTQDRIENGLYPFFVRSQTVERINSYSFDGEAILTAGDGVGVGKVIHYAYEKFDCHQRVYRISDFSKNVNGYFLFLYFSNNFYNRIMQMTAKSSVDSVRMDMIAEMQIPVPPTIEEQTAIASALSDVDALIRSLEKLISKKYNIKQGAMQKLLQSKKNWEVKKLGDIFNFYNTANYSKAEMTFDGEIGCLHYGLIHAIPHVSYSLKNGVKFYLKEDNTKYELIQDGDIVMVDASEDFLGINKCIEVSNVENRKFIAGLHTYLMRDVNNILMKNFRGLILNAAIVKQQLLKLAVGMKVYGVSKTQLKEVLIPVPPHEEQIRIATILSDMDAEIIALETKLEKYKKVKLGMMQNLLTGKIRLV